MTLSKLEIQQMLREMNVKIDADESYEVLKQRLQQENHTAWLKSGAGDLQTRGGTSPRVVKKRKRSAAVPSPPSSVTDASSESPAERLPPETSACSDFSASPQKLNSGFRPRPIEKPGPGKPWKTVSEGTEPFNRKKNVYESVLRRAGMHCECCGQLENKTDPALTLAPCYLQSPDNGGDHSIKNMVALCARCSEAMTAGTLPKSAIKELYRKTRARLYSSPEVMKKTEVVKKNSAHRRRSLSGR